MNNISPQQQLGTLVNHAVEGDNPHHAHISPIYMTSTFSFPDVAHGADIFSGEREGYVYTRIDNPNTRQLAQKYAILEGLDLLRAQPDTPPQELVAGKLFASGMAAISHALLARVRASETIIAQQALYGNAFAFLHKLAPRLGINVVWVNQPDADGWQAAFEAHPDAVMAYAETPINPTMQVVDLAMVAEIAHQYGAWAAVDNTFATPYCQRPLNQGFDLVLHSTTKYLTGHGVIIGGAIVTRHPEFLQPERDELFLTARLLGGAPSPFDAWLGNIGLKTFELRMERHCENAMQLAEWLQQHPKVARVNYPGLPDNPGHAVARQQMFNGFGGMLSFELKGGFEAGVTLMENLHVITLAISLGNTDSLIQHPASMTHAGVPVAERLKMGITDGLVRFSVGIENVEDLITDLAQALDQVAE